MRDLLAFWFLVAFSLTMVGIFALMWSMDSVRVCEDNLPIRIGEIAMFALLALFGIERMVAKIRKLLKQYSRE